MRTVRANGIAMNTVWLHPRPGTGNGGTVVLVHGAPGGSLAHWYLTVAPALAAAGPRVLMYDLRGHGRSERPVSGYRLEDLTADLAALLDDQCPGEPVVLMGMSLGGAIALAYAAGHPDRVTGVATLDSGPPTARGFAAAARFLRGDHGDPGIAARARELCDQTSFAADLRAGRPLTAAELATLTCPVLCLFGELSPLPELVTEVAATLPDAEIAVLPGADHNLVAGAVVEVRERLCAWTTRLASTAVG